MDFERAAKLRDELSALTHVRDRQQATIASEDSFDAFGAYAEHLQRIIDAAGST